MSRVVGVYVCQRGVFGVECQHHSDGLEVLRSFDVHGRIESAGDAARQLGQTLAQNGIKRADVILAVRGFHAGHHVLSFPPAADGVLDAIVEREVRRLEPEMPDPVVSWTRLPVEEGPDGQQSGQADLLVAALPRHVATEFAAAIQAAGHSLTHLTVLSVAMHRLAEEFIPDDDTAALVAQLPDGPFIGYSVGGAIRLAVEPPVPDEEALPDAAAVADEAELGAVFVRQQFRGAQVARVAVVASDEGSPELETALSERLSVEITRVPLAGLSPGAVAAFGAVLDARSPHPVALAGRTVERRSGGSAPTLQLAAIATLAAAAVVGVWAVSEAVSARSASEALREARRRIEFESSNFAPARETAGRRKLFRDALAALRVTQEDRAALQRGLNAIADAVPGSVSLDSIVLASGSSGWQATMGGSVAGPSSGLAVQSLSGFYRDLARLAPVESLSLKQLSYADTTGQSLVRFEIMFGVLGRAQH